MLYRVAILVLSIAPLLRGASAGIALFGTILDPSGAVVPEALVIAFNDDSGVRRAASSDQEGYYSMGGLTPGHYKLLVRKEGFLTAARVGLNLGPQKNVRCDFTLRVGPVAEIVTVESGPSFPDSNASAPGTILGKELIAEVPVGGRGLIGLLELIPGVLVTPANTGEAGQLSTSGQRPNTNYFSVDGVSLNTGISGAGLPGQFPGGTLPLMTAFGSLHSLTPLEDVDAVQVQTTNFAPEFGRMPGAQIAISTRSGSNSVHGTVSDSVGNNAMNANDWLANASGLSRPAMRSNDFAGSLGGPIFPNRTFFFVSYEQIGLRQPLVWVTPVPSPGARENAPPTIAPLFTAFPVPNGPVFGGDLALLRVSTTRPAMARIGSVRVDHALTSKLGIFARYATSPSWSEFGYSQVNRSDFRQNSLTGGLMAAIAPTTSNDIRLNITRAAVRSGWTSTFAGGAGPLNLAGWFPADTAFKSLSIDGIGSLNTGDGGGNSQSQTNVVDTVAVVRGNHRIRIGADYLHLGLRAHGPPTSLALNFASLSMLQSGGPGRLTYAQSTESSAGIHTISLFAQDSWIVNPRLTLTYGVRWEGAPAPLSDKSHLVYPQFHGSGLAGVPIWRGGFTNLAPRIGAAYRVTSDARSILRAGFGVFYDAGLGAATDEINASPYNSWQLGAPYGSNPSPSGPAIQYGFAGDLRLPRVREWNITWQQAWTDRGTASISYVGSSGERLLRREGMLFPAPGIAELELATSHGNSSYNGLQAQYRLRLTDGVEGLFSYTWSHSIDTGSWDSPVYLVQPGLTATQDRASSNFDVRHVFTAAVTYNLHFSKGPRLISSGWAADAIFHARTAFPIDVLAAETFDGINLANFVRPDLVPGMPVWIADANVPSARRLNSRAFASPPDGTQGSLGRNAIRGFGMSQLDLALRRAIAVTDRVSLEIRAEAANVLNQPNFADPERYLASPLFGQSTSMLNLMLGSGTPRSGLTPAFQIGGPRMVQIGLKVRF